MNQTLDFTVTPRVSKAGGRKGLSPPWPHLKGQFSLLKGRIQLKHLWALCRAEGLLHVCNHSLWINVGVNLRMAKTLLSETSVSSISCVEAGAFSRVLTPVSAVSPAGPGRRHPRHPRGAPAALLRQHRQHEGQECQKVRAHFCDFPPICPGLPVLLCWVLAVVLQWVQGVQQWFVVVCLWQGNQNPCGTEGISANGTWNWAWEVCWQTLLFLAIETRLGRVLNLTLAMILVFFSDSSWKWLIKKTP